MTPVDHTGEVHTSAAGNRAGCSCGWEGAIILPGECLAAAEEMIAHAKDVKQLELKGQK